MILRVKNLFCIAGCRLYRLYRLYKLHQHVHRKYRKSPVMKIPRFRDQVQLHHASSRQQRCAELADGLFTSALLLHDDHFIGFQPSIYWDIFVNIIDKCHAWWMMKIREAIFYPISWGRSWTMKKCRTGKRCGTSLLQKSHEIPRKISCISPFYPILSPFFGGFWTFFNNVINPAMTGNGSVYTTYLWW